MNLYFLVILSLILIWFFGRTGSFKVIYLKKLAIPLLSILFILCLVIFSKTAVNSAFKGIKLWLEIVFPSLFPFFVGSEILNRTGFVKVIGILLEPVMRPLFNVPGSGSFAFSMGITSGYPVGAKITAEMRKDKLLSRIEAERLLTFTNNSGPLFIIGAVSVGMLKRPDVGIILLSCHILACITVGMIFKFYGRKNNHANRKSEGNILRRFKNELGSDQTSFSLGNIFGEAIKNSVNLILAIGGFIIFFSVIINLLLETGFINSISEVLSAIFVPLGANKEVITSIISGFFEITTGTNMATHASSASILQKLTAASIIIGWAGLSVHSQVLSIISSTDISIKPYFMGKFLQGMIAGLYTFLYIKTAGSSILEASPVFASDQIATQLSWSSYLTGSLLYFAASLAILMVFAAIFLILKYVRKKIL